MMRSRSRISARRPEISACACMPAERFQHGMQRRLRILDHQHALGAEGQHALADFRADRAAAAGDDDRLAADELLKPLIIDLHARPQQQILDRDRRQLHRRCRPNRATAIDSWSDQAVRARMRSDSGRASGDSADGAMISARDPRAAVCRDRQPHVRDRRYRPAPECCGSIWPRSVGDGDRMPTGQIFFTAPLSIERNRTSASAARPRISTGVASATLARCSVRA